MSTTHQSFKQTLDQTHSWPCQYMFKFIVPLPQKARVLELFQEEDAISTRKSRNGQYISVTAKCRVHSSEEVIAVYEAASRIEGIVSL
jgi:putative lipoic acid-binding regulatory protein